MTARNFVPRVNEEGQLGTEKKKWSKVYSDTIYVNNIIGNLTGTADKAIKDNKNQQIDSTYIKNISINNDTLTVTKGNDDSQDITINNISHAISSDNATNANKLQELTAGNSNGQIPISNGIENVNLNAALLNGKSSNDFATSSHIHNTATQSSNGYISSADKKKLDGIASGAEVNQNAFANVKVGSNTIQADAKQDTLELAAGTNISLVGDVNNDKVTIAVTGKVASASQADNATKATNDSDGKAINATYIKKASGAGENLTLASDNFGGQLTIKRNSGNAATIKYTNTNNTSNVNRYIGFTGSDKTMYRWGDNGDGQTAFLDASNYNNYAPTKTGGGASGTWNININGNAKTSSSAPALSNKGTISASNLPNTFSSGLTTHSAYNGSYPAQYGNVINIYHAGKSQLLLEWKGDDTAAGDPGHLYYRECRDNQNVWSNWKTIAFTSDNVASATKATQDSAGQTINTTYVKAVTASNATITVTKGNGTTSTATINNVAHATNADNATNSTNSTNATNANNLVISGTSAYIKNGGGDVDESTAISQNKVNLVIGSWYSTGFRDLCSSGTPIRVAINHRTGNIKTTGAITASGGFSGNLTGNATSATKATNDSSNRNIVNTYATKASPAFSGSPTAPTPGTSDNSTRIATTAFVQSLINSLKGSIGGTIVASNLAQNGYVKFSNGFIIQWGYMFKTGDSNAVFTYPITFSSRVIFADYSIKIQNSYKGEHSLGAFTNTSLTINMSQIFESYLYFLVIGY